MYNLLTAAGSLPNYLVFFLVLLRLAGFMQTVPLFGSGAVPILVRLFFSIVLAVFFFNFYPPPAVEFSLLNALDFLLIAVAEIFLGVLLGLLLRVVFFAVLSAADIISNMIGFSYASFLNPQDNQPSATLGVFLELFAVLIFLAMDFHHFLVEFMYQSYALLPVFEYNIRQFSYISVTNFANQIFILGLVFASPMIASSVILNLSLGFANRSVPQMNVFLVGTSLLVGLSIVFLAISMPFFGEAFYNAWLNIIGMIQELLAPP